jgi:hypothetical protein
MWNVHKFSKQAADNLGTKYKYILIHFSATSEILCNVDPIFCHFSSYQFHAKEKEIHAINGTQLWMKHSLVTNTHRNESHHAKSTLECITYHAFTNTHDKAYHD